MGPRKADSRSKMTLAPIFWDRKFSQSFLGGFTLATSNGTPLQYSCLENPIDGGAWKAAVHGVAEGWTRLSDFTSTFHFYALEKEMAIHSSISIEPWKQIRASRHVEVGLSRSFSHCGRKPWVPSINILIKENTCLVLAHKDD